MNDDPRWDDLFQNAPAPRVRESVHRARLKNQLLHEFRKEQSIVKTRYSRKQVFVYTCLLAFFFAAASWASYEYGFKMFIVEKEIIQLPDGSMQGVYTCTVTSNDPDFSQEVADRQFKEIKQLIAQKNYQFLEEKEVDGRKIYLYNFTLADGTVICHGTSEPLN